MFINLRNWTLSLLFECKTFEILNFKLIVCVHDI